MKPSIKLHAQRRAKVNVLFWYVLKANKLTIGKRVSDCNGTNKKEYKCLTGLLDRCLEDIDNTSVDSIDPLELSEFRQQRTCVVAIVQTVLTALSDKMTSATTCKVTDTFHATMPYAETTMTHHVNQFLVINI
jgi:hypothetical protein